MEGIKLCTWVYLSLADTNELVQCCSDREVLKQELCKKLRLDCGSDHASVKQYLIEGDLYTYAFLFGIREKYSPAQLSTFISIVKQLHNMCVSSVFDNYSEALSYFQKLVVQHSVNRPPFSIQIFNPSEVKNLNEYVLSTYFKHYKLYKFAFTRRVHMNITLSYAGEPVENNAEDIDATVQERSVDEEDKESTGQVVPGTPPDATNLKLKDMICSDLNKMVQQEQEKLQSQLAAQETRLLGRISTLEASIDPKRPPTANSGKKKNKTTH